MPIQVRVSSELGLAVVVFEGVVTADEFAQRAAPLIEDPEISFLPLSLIDLTATERGEVPSEIVRRHAQRAGHNIDGTIEGPSRMAIAASSDEFYGLGRMYEMLRGDSPVEFAVFRSRREAEEWLGLPSDYEAQLTDVF